MLRTEPGSITSPGFPSDYPANTTCSNLIVAPEGQVVEVSVAFLSVEESPGCRKDALLVSDVSDVQPFIMIHLNIHEILSFLGGRDNHKFTVICIRSG